MWKRKRIIIIYDVSVRELTTTKSNTIIDRILLSLHALHYIYISYSAIFARSTIFDNTICDESNTHSSRDDDIAILIISLFLTINTTI